jgi:hypothetical protein
LGIEGGRSPLFPTPWSKEEEDFSRRWRRREGRWIQLLYYFEEFRNTP